MKNVLLFTFLFFASSLMANIQVIFDPATYEPDSLNDGMTIVDIEGTKYVQIVLDGWNSSITIDPSIEIESGMTHFRGTLKYAVGTSGFELSNINTFFKLATAGDVELGATGYQSTSDFLEKQVAFATTGSVGYIQVAGQERTGWSAVVGDTIWLSKVEAVNVDPLAIFDPNIFDPAKLPSGMSIVEKDGIKYCQVITDGWNSSIPVSPYTIGSGITHFRVRAQYNVGTSGFDVSTINLFLKIANASTEIAASGFQAEDSVFTTYKVAITTAGAVDYVQVAGQERTGWSATVGDTIWIGKVRALTVDPKVALDPAQVDPVELPDGMSIVKVGATSYLQTILNGWNSALAIDPVIITGTYTNFSAMTKYAVGSSGFELSNINTFLKLANADFSLEIGATGAQSTADFTNMIVPVTNAGSAANLQVAGQERTGWSAVVGDTLWVAKVMLLDMQKPSKPDNLAAVVDGSDVTLTWDASTDNAAVAGYIVSQDEVELETVTTTTYAVNGLADGTYTFSVVALDNSDNLSTAATVDATTPGVGLNDAAQQQFIIYPNPVTEGLLNLDITGIDGQYTVAVYNLSGNLVYTTSSSEQTITLSTTGFASGVYTVKVANNDAVMVQKVLVK